MCADHSKSPEASILRRRACAGENIYPEPPPSPRSHAPESPERIDAVLGLTRRRNLVLGPAISSAKPIVKNRSKPTNPPETTITLFAPGHVP